jgi:glycosyltransferase involved in cell wall biosynthesis
MTTNHFPFSLTVFFPAYNDAPSLPGLLATTFRVLKQHVEDFEVLVINDGSADNTGAVLRELQVQYGDRLRVVTHPENRGYGGALNSGFRGATKEFVFYTDGDGQYDVADLPKLLALSGPDVGLVNGIKAKRHDPLHRIWIGKAYNQFARTMFGISLSDIDCDFRLIRRATLERVHLTSTSGTICVELVKKIELTGTRIVEIPVLHKARLHGSSQFFRIKSLATTLRQLIGLYWTLVLHPWIGRGSSSMSPAEQDRLHLK